MGKLGFAVTTSIGVDMSGVRYPEMRNDIIDALRALADRTYQQRVWVDRIYPRPGYYDDLTHNINVLYDDTLVAEDPSSQVGVSLKDGREVAAIEALKEILDPILDSISPDDSDLDVISRPDWTNVVIAAGNAIRVLSS